MKVGTPRIRPASTGAVEVKPPMPRTTCGLNFPIDRAAEREAFVEAPEKPKIAAKTATAAQQSAIFRSEIGIARDGQRVDLLFGNEEHHFVPRRAQHFRDREAREKMPAGSATCDHRVHADSSSDEFAGVHAHLHGRSLAVHRLEHALPINVQKQSDPKQTRGEIRSAVADEGQRQALVRQERSRHADVDRRLQAEQRNDAAPEQESETILGVQARSSFRKR